MKRSEVRSETAAPYIQPQTDREREDAIIERAFDIISKRMNRSDCEEFTQPERAAQYFKLRLAALEHEVFSVAFLDTRHRLIACENMFRGSIDGASVHPREVVKRAMQLNAAAIIISHNHPSGNPEPSTADRMITQRLREALELVDVRVLDHIVVGGTQHVSLAMRGWM